MYLSARSWKFFAAAICSAVLFTNCNQSVPETRPPSLTIASLAPLPQEVGTGDFFFGAHNGALMIGGRGSDTIWIWEEKGRVWTGRYRLPRPLAGGAAISTGGGVILAGGSSDRGLRADVRRLAWDATRRELRIDTLPPLPRPAADPAGAIVGRTLYLLTGRQANSSDYSAFWALDMGRPEEQQSWKSLPPPPGSPRGEVTVSVQTDGRGKPLLYVFGGAVSGDGRDSSGFFAYSFDPVARRWTRRAGPPRLPGRLLSGPVGQSHILVASAGSAAGAVYHTITDTWALVDSLPESLAAIPPVLLNGNLAMIGSRPSAVLTVGPAREWGAFMPVDYLVLILYLAALVGVGLYFTRRERGTDDFFLAGRRIPWWAAGLSIFATQLSAITFLSVPAVAYATNWVVYLAYLGIFAMAPVVIIFYLPFFRRLPITTAYEYLERRFGPAVRLFGSASFIAFQLARLAIVIYLPALALAAATGLDVYLCILLMAVLATLYTALGGMEAVVWTDVLQTAVLMGGIILSLLVILYQTGTEEFLQLARAEDKMQIFDWRLSGTELVSLAVLIGAFFNNFGPYTTDQAVIQRYLTTKDERSAARSIWLNGLISLPAGVLFFLLGTALYVFYKQHPESLAVGMQQDEIFPLFIARELPPGLSGLLIAGIFAASMSSIDSSIHSVTTAAITDFYGRFRSRSTDRQRLFLARVLVIAIGLLSMSGAMALVRYDIQSLFFLFQRVLGLLGSTLAGVFMLGIFTTRANSAGALSGAAAATLLLLYVAFHTPLNFYWYAVIGIPVCVLVGYAVSRVTGGHRGELQGLTWFSRGRE